jgi:hypothetical protein
MPSKESLKGAPPKVVVFDFRENDNIIASQAGLGKSLAVDVENVLTQNRLAKLIDRKIAKNLEKEILLSQMSGSESSYNGPSVADYAVSGSISNATFVNKYKAGMMLYDKQRGFYKTAPKFQYSSEVSGNVKIYEIPSMDVIENFEFSGYKGRSENIQKNGGVSIAGIINIGVKNAKGLKRDDGMVRQAGENGMDNVSVAIKNALAKKAYILEKKSFKGKSIFKISLGKEDGVTHGDSFDVIGHFEVENPITSEVEIEKRILATGRVADKINPKYSWIVLDKKEFINNVRLGDVVKFKYKKTFTQKISKYNKYLPN